MLTEALHSMCTKHNTLCWHQHDACHKSSPFEHLGHILPKLQCLDAKVCLYIYIYIYITTIFELCRNGQFVREAVGRGGSPWVGQVSCQIGAIKCSATEFGVNLSNYIQDLNPT